MPFGHTDINTISVYIRGAGKSREMGIFLPFLSLDKDIKNRTRMYGYGKKNIQV